MSKERIVLFERDGIRVNEPDGIQRIYDGKDETTTHLHPKDGSRLVCGRFCGQQVMVYYSAKDEKDFPYERVGIFFDPEKITGAEADLKTGRHAIKQKPRSLFSSFDIAQKLPPSPPGTELEIDFNGSVRDHPPSGMLKSGGFTVLSAGQANQKAFYKDLAGKNLAESFVPTAEVAAIIKTPPLAAFMEKARKFGFNIALAEEHHRMKAPQDDKRFAEEAAAAVSAVAGRLGYAQSFKEASETVQSLRAQVEKLGDGVDGIRSQALETHELMARHGVDGGDDLKKGTDALNQLRTEADELVVAAASLQRCIASLDEPVGVERETVLAGRRIVNNKGRSGPQL